MLNLGSQNVSKLYLGGTSISKAYLGESLVWSATQPLPYDAEVEYLESTGTQYIDTGIYVTGNDSCVVRAAITQLGSSNTDYRQIFGARKSATQKCAEIFYNNSQMYVSFNNGSFSNRVIYLIARNIRYRIITSNAERSIFNEDTNVCLGQDTTAQSYDFTTETTAFLFAESGVPASATITPGYLKIFSCQIIDTQTGKLRLDMIPVRFTNELGQSEGAMYDRVTKKLFRNQGTGDFIVGPDVVEVEYLESTGTQYIDLGVNSTTDGFCNFDIRYRLTVNSEPPFGYKYGATARYGMWGGTGYTYVGANAANSIQIATDTNWHSVSLRNGSYIEVDGVKSTVGSASVRANIGINLFAVVTSASDATSRMLSKACVASLVLYDTQGNKIRDFIPVRVGMEGAMMDKLTRKIYRNQGTGAFKIGADKKETPLMCNSYVKDGLVAMWDGIENAGWGVHDANATTWKDLIRGTDCEFFGTTGNPIWTDNAWSSPSYLLTNSGAFHATFPDAGTDGSCTFEFVALKSYNSRGSVMSYFTVPDASTSLAVEWQTAPNNRARFYYGGNPDTVSTTDSFPLNTRRYFAGVCSEKRAYKIYGVNAEVLYNATFGTDKLSMAASLAYIGNDGRNNMGWYGEINSIRIYNRALTAEEIAWNYEIDKRRFNLP